jgi:hypothetical protein
MSGSFSSDPRSEPRGLVSQHEALQRLRRDIHAMVSLVDIHLVVTEDIQHSSGVPHSAYLPAI